MSSLNIQWNLNFNEWYNFNYVLIKNSYCRCLQHLSAGRFQCNTVQHLGKSSVAEDWVDKKNKLVKWSKFRPEFTYWNLKVVSISIFMTSSVYPAGGYIFLWMTPRMEPAQWGVYSKWLLSGVLEVVNVKGAVIVTVGYKSFTASTYARLLKWYLQYLNFFKLRKKRVK